jgi:hypothetical protein
MPSYQLVDGNISACFVEIGEFKGSLQHLVVSLIENYSQTLDRSHPVERFSWSLIYLLCNDPLNSPFHTHTKDALIRTSAPVRVGETPTDLIAMIEL